jgi:hypothetical protein
MTAEFVKPKTTVAKFYKAKFSCIREYNEGDLVHDAILLHALLESLERHAISGTIMPIAAEIMEKKFGYVEENKPQDPYTGNV